MPAAKFTKVVMGWGVGGACVNSPLVQLQPALLTSQLALRACVHRGSRGGYGLTQSASSRVKLQVAARIRLTLMHANLQYGS